VAVRLEPIILELEREQKDLLIIAHEGVLRVLYGYLMACNAADIPFLSFPRNEIIEVPSLEHADLPLANVIPQIIPASYNNEAKRIKIPGVPEDIIPPSPEGLKIPAPPSGWTTPQPGLGSPALHAMNAPERGHKTPEGYKTPEDSGELAIRIHDVV
jgi:6-phosphofructo-2-kinase / fructose-2,6-biphosphatase 4